MQKKSDLQPNWSWLVQISVFREVQHKKKAVESCRKDL